MPPDDDDLRVQAYIQRLAELRDNDPTAAGVQLNAEDLREIAVEVGIRPELVARAEQQARDQVRRAEQLIAAQRYDDAIDALLVAVDVLPYEDKPHELLERAARLKSANSGGKVVRTVLITAVLALAIGVAAGMLLRDRPSSSPVAVVPTQSRPLQAARPDPPRPPTPRPRPAPPPRKVARFHRPADRELDVQWVGGKHLAASTITNQRAVLNVYKDHAWLKASFEIVPGGDRELTQLQLQAAALDGAGKVVAAATQTAVRGYQGPVRADDRVAVRFLIRCDDSVQGLRVRPVIARTQPGLASYKPEDPVSVQWLAAAPEGVKLSVTARRVRIRSPASKWYAEIALNVRNNGERALRHLKIEVRFVDKNGEVLDSVPRYVLMKDDPPLLPGTARLKTVIKSLSARPAGWTVVVIDARD